jgi:hypothetical protein
MITTTTTTTPAPSLAELQAQLRAALVAYPELRRGLSAALADLERAQGGARTELARRDRRRVDGLR